jgi:UDP:flavonoid glycosyltransferase YjiC (YdhE family)
MARLLLAWELGGGLGHVLPLGQLAVALRARGHEVDLVLRDLSLAAQALGPALDDPALRLWQAPLWLHPCQPATEPACFAELFFDAGYLDPARLLGLVRGWRQSIRQLRPDLIVADFAPTALLAARGLGVACLPFGSGFSMPPPLSPVPSYRAWERPPAARAAEAEAAVLATCNQVLRSLGEAPLPALHALFDGPELWISAWLELDPYGAQRGPQRRHYWGVSPQPAHGLAAEWPGGAGPRVLAYLHAQHTAFEQILARLASGPWCCLVSVSGLSEAAAQRLDGPQLKVVTQPLSLGPALARAAAHLGHGGLGVTTAALAAGVPCVLLPLHDEQLLTARLVSRAGAGVYLWPEEAAAGLQPALQAVLGSPGFAQAPRTMAALQTPAPSLQVMDSMAERCERFLKTAPVA